MAQSYNPDRLDMWIMLTNLVEHNNNDLVNILDMIAKNLTYEEPGLFASNLNLNKEECDMEESFNLWLLNQLMYILNVSEAKSIQKSVIKLQKEILSAALLKRSGFFVRMVKDYIKMLGTLIEIEYNNEPNPKHEIDYFVDENTKLKEINSSIKFWKVEIKNISNVNLNVKTILELLNHAVFLRIHSHEDLFISSLEVVLRIFSSFTLHIKAACVFYVSNVCDTIYEAKELLYQAYTNILIGCKSVVQKIVMWLKLNVIEESHIQIFFNSLKTLFRCNLCFNTTSQFPVKHYRKYVVEQSIDLLCAIASCKEYIELESQLPQTIIQFVYILCSKFNENYFCKNGLKNLFVLLRKYDQVTHFKLFECYFVRHIAEIESKIVTLYSQNSWSDFCTIFLEKLHTINQKSEWNVKELEIFNFLNTICEIEHNSTIEFQKDQHFSKLQSIKIEYFETVDLRFSKLLTTFFKKYEQNNQKSTEITVTLIKMCQHILECSLAEYTNQILQEILINFVLYFPKNYLEIPLKQHQRQINANDNQTKAILLEASMESASNVNTNYLLMESKQNLISNINKIINKAFHPNTGDKTIQQVIINNMSNFIGNEIISVESINFLINECLKQNLKQHLFSNIKLCFFYNDILMVKIRDTKVHVEMICLKCEEKNALEVIKKKNGRILFMNSPRNDYNFMKDHFEKHENISLLKPQVIVNHLSLEFIKEIISDLSPAFPNILRLLILNSKPLDSEAINILKKMTTIVLDNVKESLKNSDQNKQVKAIEHLKQISIVDGIYETWLFNFFKMTFFYFIRSESVVTNQAEQCAIEMCFKYGIRPKNILNWYKRDALKLIISLAVCIYIKDGVPIDKALASISRMLGFSCAREFICKYYKIMIAMILPHCVQFPQCKNILYDIALITRKHFSHLLMSSFLTTYTHIFFNEDSETSSKCINFIKTETNCSLYNLMQTDVKKTVSEILVWFHKNLNYVMYSFRCLLSEQFANSSSDVHLTDQVNDSNINPKDIAKYIADRFLGILTYFEACLIDGDFEKSLKIEILRSFGEIIRFIGAEHITPFRFKILAMLTTITALSDTNLQSICIDIWNIFVHNVDIEALGPSLGRIVASLEPLTETNNKEVNNILHFLIISQGNLLSYYIPDLYFIEFFKTSNHIKEFVAKQTEIYWKGKDFIEKFNYFSEQIIHENLFVRIYGLKHLTKFVATNRRSLNQLIIGHNDDNQIIERVLENLMVCCKHVDHNLKLESGKCFGELGAIEPRHLCPNYSQKQNDFSLSVHTETFAIMALKELCQAYQLQKDTKYVDNFSLAIQEILHMRGICPEDSKKNQVWNSFPERMRQIMRPLLKSSYTGLQRQTICPAHPIFGSSYSRTYEEWAFTWASKMIEYVRDESTKHLLNSLKPSIKRDSNILAQFLPYIVRHALETSTPDETELMYEELKCVFEFAVKHDYGGMEYNTMGMKGFPSYNYIPTKRDSDKGANVPAEYISIKCAKIGFDQIDFLDRWLREWKKQNYSKRNLGGHSSKEKLDCTKIEKFVNKFDKLLLAQANLNSGEYARALMYIEMYIDTNPDILLQSNLSFLIQIYAELMDPDSLEGAVNLKKSNLSLSEQILVNSMTDHLQETTICYEQVMSKCNEIQQEDIQGLIQCYLRLDTPDTALLITEGLWRQLGDRFTDEYFKECQVEPLWRMTRFDELEELLNDPVVRKSPSWEVQCGQSLLLLRQPFITVNDFQEMIDQIRLNILKQFKTVGAEQDSYHKGYSQVLKLHLISEIEKAKLLTIQLCTDGLNESKKLKTVEEFFQDWNSRLKFLQPSVRSTEPVLCLRRIILTEIKKLLISSENLLNKSIGDETIKLIDTEIGNLWIRSIKLNRKAGWFQQAHISIMNAEEYQPETLFVEKAKLFWQKGDQTNAFKIIQQKINEINSIGAIETQNDSNKLLYSKAKFLLATFNAESMNICSEMNIKYFQESLQAYRRSEKCLVHLAQYLDKMHAAMTDEQQSSNYGLELLCEIMRNYAKSMTFGCEFVYQSMPRLLSIWFDFTSQRKLDDNYRNISTKMCEMVDKCSKSLPAFVFFSAFSQIISRICHPSLEVYQVLKTIIIRLIYKFPQQSLWMILPVCKSSYTNRSKRGIEIFQDKRLDNLEMRSLIKDFNMLAERLIELTNKEIPSNMPNPKVSSLVRQLPKMFQDPKFSKIILPFEKFMQISLPPIDERNSPANSHNPFPFNEVYIRGIKEDITVIQSLQKPRKVILIGSDGHEYAVMMKPKDDLRKDFRLMEFNALVQQYLFQDPHARQRGLRIRTYAVLPLNEECGLIEWVPNLKGLRPIINELTKARGFGMSNQELKACMCAARDPLERKRNIFEKCLLPKHPPVFHEWFIYRFTTPHNWYQARSAYIRTTAVMSVVGYILGLGDRHGENVLFDKTNGDTMHVDFNCLFNRGEAFEFPEKVPFRLTHNMVHAMGPLGTEGLYRRCCEITMRVLKMQTSILMSVLRPFVYDPLVTWNRDTSNKEKAERTDPKALANVKRIEERLNGYIQIKGKASNMPLSTEGQVNHIISEATNVDNLASMYIGWGPYL